MTGTSPGLFSARCRQSLRSLVHSSSHQADSALDPASKTCWRPVFKFDCAEAYRCPGIYVARPLIGGIHLAIRGVIWIVTRWVMSMVLLGDGAESPAAGTKRSSFGLPIHWRSGAVVPVRLHG